MTAAPASLVSSLVDRYRIERELGQGGMATVYLAEDVRHRRKVALKVLRPELAAILGAERFLKEIELTANLQHPNILPLYDSGEADSFLYYVMPYVEGETLRGKLTREKQLGVEEAVTIAKAVAAALQYAHEQGIVHRDIKPENILLQRGQPLVADFGIALAVSQAGGTRLTETGLSLGTPHYMSPEQATGDRELTARSDVYSLGAVLYEMLTGDPPHVGSTVQAIVAKVLAEPAPPVRRTRPLVPPHVDAAVQCALAKIPADRFATAADFANALANPAFAQTVEAARTMAAPPRRWNRLAAAAAALALGFAGLSLWALTRPKAEPPVARYSIALPAAEAISNGAPVLGRRIALSPDGATVVYVGFAGVGGNFQLWARSRNQLNARPIPGTEAGRRPFFSPDGQQVGFFGADQVLRIVSLTGEPPRVLNSTDTDASGGAWSPDGYIYAGARRQGLGAPVGLVRIPTNGGPAEPVTKLNAGERYHQWPFVLPGGRGVLFTANTTASTRGLRLAVVDLRTGQHRFLLEAVTGWYTPTGHLLYVTGDGTLVAAPFNEERLEITGPGRTLFGGVGIHAFGADLTFAADGSLLYLSGASGLIGQPVWVDRQGRTEAVDPAWRFQIGALYSTATLSPDGTRLAISQEEETGQHIRIKHLPRGPAAKLTFEGSLNSRATWSKDGRSVVFISDRDGGVNRPWIQVADGSAPPALLIDRPANEAFISPDGEWVVYRGIAGDRHVYAVRTSGDTTTLTVAKSAGAEEVAPDLSADGRWIAYVSDESGRDEIYVRPFPDVTSSKRQVSTAGGLEPRWSRDGRELFFRNARDELVAVQAHVVGRSFTAGPEQVLFRMDQFLPPNRFQPTYDVSPDGRRFVLIRSAGEGGRTSELILVQNFFADLRRGATP